MLFYSTDELLRLPNQSWLIHRLLPGTGLSLLYGPPGEGKSFVALDWALSVSTGRPWLGKFPAKHGHVVYIAAEGGRGIKKRVAAWMRFYAVKNLPNITWFLDALNLHQDGVVDAFMEALESRFGLTVVQDTDGEPIEVSDLNLKLIVVDTLSRNFGGEDENASAPMARFVERLEALAKPHGAMVLTVHHTNATGARERGHTALKGAMEAVFHCTAQKAESRLELVMVRNVKQKDDRDADLIVLKALELELPELPLDDEGNIQTSLVFEWAPAPPETEKGLAVEAGLRGKDMLRLLGASEHGYRFEEWRLACGLNKSAFIRRLRRLLNDGKVEKDDETGKYVVVDLEE